MMCGFTALGAFLLSVAYKGGSSPVAGIVLLSIGGACNLWAVEMGMIAFALTMIALQLVAITCLYF